jgi:hypothetical protein
MCWGPRHESLKIGKLAMYRTLEPWPPSQLRQSKTQALAS